VFTPKEIQAINQRVSNEEFETEVLLSLDSDTKNNRVTYSFEIIGIKPMISVGEFYDYVVYDITILDASDKLKKFLTFLLKTLVKKMQNKN